MAHEQQNTVSILDFLYVDTDRIKSWLAQLHSDGVLLTHKKTESSSSASTHETGGSVEATGNAGIVLAKAGLKANAQGKSGAAESLSATHEKNFDSSWTIPLNFLDLASEFELIESDISSATVGSLVKFSGRPQVRDLKFLQDIWSPAINHLMSEAQVTHKNKAALAHQKKQLTGFGDILKVMPPNPQMVVCSEEDILVWSMLVEQNMRVSSSSLALAHGFSIEGTWRMIGILDAIPDQEDKAPSPAVFEHELFDAMSEIVDAVRAMMGRPAKAYGLTPLVIYRMVETKVDTPEN